MRLSVPIYRLKRRARLLARENAIPLNQALDRVAREEGYARWSLLAARESGAPPSRTVLSRLEEGDLLLLGARPGHGKTMMGLELLLDAAAEGREAVFFTLFHTEREVADQLRSLGADRARLAGLVSVVTSDDIGSDFIIDHMRDAPPGAVAVVDYLQILDQQRSKPEVAVQIAALRRFARAQRVVLAFLSQIDRSYDPELKPVPDMGDVRLPDRLDPELFSKTCFLHDGELRFQATA